MMIFFSKVNRFYFFIVITVVFLSYPCFGQNDSGSQFADYLINQKDYFRAITVYKRLLFEARENELRYQYAYKIGKAYRLSGKHKSSIYFYAESLHYASTRDEHVNSLIGLGLNYYHMKTLPLAKNYFVQSSKHDSTSKATFFIGLVQLEEEQWTKARNTFGSVERQSENNIYIEKAKLLQQKSEIGRNLPQKSPLLAAILSSIIPGSGQMYSGHYFDGLQALAYVGAFSLATYGAYRYDREISDSDAVLFLSATVTGFFYLANVLGAHRTAQYRNGRIKQNFMDEVRNIIFEFSF